jgi:hypothetical protein
MGMQRILVSTLVGLLLSGTACSKKEATGGAEQKKGKEPALPIETALDRADFAETCVFQAHKNSVAAMRANKENLDAVAKLDWRNDEVTEEQQESVHQLQTAEVIDQAISVQEWARESRPGNFRTAYDQYSKQIEAMAKTNWRSGRIGGDYLDALDRVRFAYFVDQAAAFHDAAKRITSGNFATVYSRNAKWVETLAKKNWKSGSLAEGEESAMKKVYAAYDIDLAHAMQETRATAAPGGYQSDYDKWAREIESLAKQKPGEKITDEEDAALCNVLAAYRKEKKDKAPAK